MRAWPWLLLLCACDAPTLSLAQRGVDAGARDAGSPDAARADDGDAEAEEDFTPCSSAAQCPGPREPNEVLCDLARGACVECLRDADCPPGESCDADGECDD